MDTKPAKGDAPVGPWRIRRIAGIAAAVVGLSLLLPVLVKIPFGQKGIAAALSQAVGRPVRFGAVRLPPFRAPCF